MKLATLRLPAGMSAARVDENEAILVDGYRDVGALLANPRWREIAESSSGQRISLDALALNAWAAVVPAPSKIICVGLNYREHILEMGRALPEHPTLFAKYPEALIGAHDDILVPQHAASTVDWEGELAVVIGAPARNVNRDDAAIAIAGYSVLNDVTMRDYQYRTLQWLQGKTFESTCPFGPVLVTPDEFAVGAELSTTIDQERVQYAHTDDLVFDAPDLISYISHILTLNPGDVVATGTPGGVGHARQEPRYLRDGETVSVDITGIGALVNRVTIVSS